METGLPSYNFHVRLGLLPISIGFQKVNGIQYEIETMSYQEGGNNYNVHVFPKSAENANTLIMERGCFLTNEITFMVGEKIPYLSIDVMSNQHLVLKTYIVKNAIVKKWSVSAFNAQESALQIDLFELAYGEIYYT